MENYVKIYKSHNLPLFKIENLQIPRIILGHNPLWGASYFSKARTSEYKERFSNVGNIVDLISHAIERGIAGIFLSCEDFVVKVIEAVKEVKTKKGIDLFVLSNVYDLKDLNRLLDIADSVKVLVLHGGMTERIYCEEKKDFEGIKDILAAFRKFGAIPGIVTHDPVKHIPIINEKDYDIKVVVSPFNKTGWAMRQDLARGIKAIESCKVPFIAIKPLAMGRIPPQEALEFVLTKPYVSGVTLGIGSKYEIDEDIEIIHEILKNKK